MLSPISVTPQGVGTLTPTGPTAPTDAPKQTEGRSIGGAIASFFKSIGEAFVGAFKAIGAGIAGLAPKSRPVSEGLSPEARAAFDKFVNLRSEQAREGSGVTAKEVLAAKRELVKLLSEELTESPLFQAALNEPDKTVLNNSEKVFAFESPEAALSDAITALLEKPERMQEIIDRGMSIDEAVAVYTYTRGAYMGINGGLRGGNPSEFIQTFEATLRSGMDKLDPPGGPVYRVVSLPPSVDGNHKPGNVVSDSGIMSTTADVEFDYEGGAKSHVISISPSGSSAGRDVSWLSESPHEQEVIFPPGTQFKVLSRDTDATPVQTGTDKAGNPTYDCQVGLILVEI